MYKLEEYLNKGSYPYFSACEKIYTIHGKEELIIGKDKYFSTMDTYIAKCITDKEYNKDEVITNLINIILSQLELKAYNTANSFLNKKVEFMVPPTCFIREDLEQWEYNIKSVAPNVKCIAIKCRVGFLNPVGLENLTRKLYMFYESDYLLINETIHI